MSPSLAKPTACRGCPLDDAYTADDRYATVVIDPPWPTTAGRTIGRYVRDDTKQVFGVVANRARPLAYPTLTLAQISALPIGAIAAEDAHLYLWTINRYVAEAYQIAAAWGFRPSTWLVWAKRPMGGGLGSDAYGLATEFCLFARRGRLKPLRRISGNWWTWKRPYVNGYPRHSGKPADFFAMVESVSPGPRIELFARAPRVGWAVWGNEVVSDVEITCLA